MGDGNSVPLGSSWI